MISISTCKYLGYFACIFKQKLIQIDWQASENCLHSPWSWLLLAFQLEWPAMMDRSYHRKTLKATIVKQKQKHCAGSLRTQSTRILKHANCLFVCLSIELFLCTLSISLFHLCVVVVVVLLRGNVNRRAWSFLCTQKKCNIKVNSYEFVWWRWNEVTHCTRNWGKDHTDESTTDGRCRITANKQLLCDIVMKNSATER